MLIGLGSVPSSGRPALDETALTSGNLRSASRISRVTFCASATETPAGRSALTHTMPSFNSGRNSVPR